jgi:ABC-type Fe3+-hydroxamate transport system substrate-binding protein
MRWEAVLRLNPTHILLMESQAEGSGLDLCRSLSIPVLVLSFHALDDIPANIRRVGAFLHRPDRGEAAARGFEERLSALARRPTLSALYILWWTPLRAAGRGSFIGQGLARMGLYTPVKGDGFPEISLEAVLTMAPDLILYPEEAGPPPSGLLDRGPWTLMPVKGDLWNRPSVRFPQALEVLSHELEK